MKIGFITEGAKGGMESQIYAYVSLQLCTTLQIIGTIPLGERNKVLNSSSEDIRKLIELGCDSVFVIWDRMPKWSGSDKCEDHINILTRNLTAAGIEIGRIKMCCIDEEMESWMIVDGRGVTDYFRNKINVQVPKFEDNKKPAEQAHPKNRIWNHVGRKKYNPYLDNFGIIKCLPNFDLASRWNPSFREFRGFVDEICPD